MMDVLPREVHNEPSVPKIRSAPCRLGETRPPRATPLWHTGQDLRKRQVFPPGDGGASKAGLLVEVSFCPPAALGSVELPPQATTSIVIAQTTIKVFMMRKMKVDEWTGSYSHALRI
jgi:hypothetical protein